MKLESQLTAALKKHLINALGGVVFKHADAITAGIPDLSVTWNGHTSWVEVKRGKGVKTRGVQAYTLRQLSAEGSCWVVQYTEEVTRIWRPAHVDPEHWTLVSEVAGTNHTHVVDFIRGVHSDHDR